MYHRSQTSKAKPMSPSELRRIGGEDVEYDVTSTS
jgi:hypothetical protein